MRWHYLPFTAGKYIPAIQSLEQQAPRRLSVLNAARTLDALKVLRCGRLEVLRGDQAGQYPTRINSQWRICFIWFKEQSGPSTLR